jgi:hypothetical protein
MDSPQPIPLNGTYQIIQELLHPIDGPQKKTNYTGIKEHFQEFQRNLTLQIQALPRNASQAIFHSAVDSTNGASTDLFWLAVIMPILAILMWIIYGAIVAHLPSDISGWRPEPKISKSSIFTLSKTTL